MELGALLVTQGAALRNPESQEMSTWCSVWPVVGKTVAERWVDRVRSMRVNTVSVVDRCVSVSDRLQRMVEWAKEGVEQILVIGMGSYAEVDLPDLLHFHHEGGTELPAYSILRVRLGSACSIVARCCVMLLPGSELYHLHHDTISTAM